MNSSNQSEMSESEMSEHEKSITMEPKNAEEDMERQKEKVESDDDSDDEEESENEDADEDTDEEAEAEALALEAELAEMKRKAKEAETRLADDRKKRAEKKKKKAKAELEAEMIEEFKVEDERLKWLNSNLAKVDDWTKERNQINEKKQTALREKEKRHQTEHETAVDKAVGCKGYIRDSIWHIILKNPTDGIQLTCHKGVPIEFDGPVPFLKNMLQNSKGQPTDLSLESVRRYDDPTQSDIVRTKAGLQHIIKQLYHGATASMNSHVKVRKLT